MNAKKQKKELPSFQLDSPRYFILNLFLVFQIFTIHITLFAIILGLCPVALFSTLTVSPLGILQIVLPLWLGASRMVSGLFCVLITAVHTVPSVSSAAISSPDFGCLPGL